MNDRELMLSSVRDLYTLQNRLLSTLSADAFRAVDLERQLAATVWLSRGTFRPGTQRAEAFLQRLRFICSQMPPMIDILNFGIDSQGIGFVSLPLLDGSIAVTPLRDASEIERRFLRMLRILDRMHSEGLIVGDLCPASFWFNRSGEVSLVSACGPDGGEYHAGEVSLPDDVIPFCAPEIFRSESMTFRSDVYSLGAIAWQMIYGNLAPFVSRGSDGSLLFPPQSPGVSPPVWANEILSIALNENGLERFSDAGAMMRALAAAKDRSVSDANLPVRRNQTLLPMTSQPRLLVRHKPAPKIETEEEPAAQPAPKMSARSVVILVLSTIGVGLAVLAFYLEDASHEDLQNVSLPAPVHGKLDTDRPLKEALLEVNRDAEQVTDDHEKLKKLIASRDPIAHDTLVQLALGAKSLEKRRKVEEALIDRARRMGSIRAAEEARVWMQGLSEGVPPSYETILRAIDPTLPQDACERYIRQAYTQLPALSMRLTAALGFDAKDIDRYQMLLAQLIGDSLKLDDARSHSAAALVLADPVTSETYADDVIQGIVRIPDADIQWLLDLLALRRDPNIKVVAHAAIDRNLLGPGKRIFAKILRDRDDISAQLSVSLVNAVAGTLTVHDIGEIGNWYDLQGQAALLGVLATNSDQNILREAFDTVASKVKKGEISSLLIDRIRNHYWETRVEYAQLVGMVAYAEEYSDTQLDEVLEKNQKLIVADNKILDTLLLTQQPNFLRVLIKRFPDSLGAGRLINLLSFKDVSVKLLAIAQLKEYNQVQLLQLILEAFNRESDEVVRQAYRDSFWFIKDRETKKK